MSVQAVTAALYMPEGAQKWHPDILWQPIPAHPASWHEVNRPEFFNEQRALIGLGVQLIKGYFYKCQKIIIGVGN